MICTYDEARNNICDGDLIFFHGHHTLVSKAIQFFTRGVYTHVGIAFWIDICGRKRLMVVEAQGGTNRRILNLSYYEKREFDVISGLQKWENISEDALNSLGQVKYSWIDAVYVGLKEFVKPVIELPDRNFSGQICSEFVAELQGIEMKSYSPTSLYNTIRENYAGVLKCEVKK